MRWKGKRGDYCLKIMKFQLLRMNKFCRSNVWHGEYSLDTVNNTALCTGNLLTGHLHKAGKKNSCHSVGEMSFWALSTDMAQKQGHSVMCSNAKERGASWNERLVPRLCWRVLWEAGALSCARKLGSLRRLMVLCQKTTGTNLKCTWDNLSTKKRIMALVNWHPLNLKNH